MISAELSIRTESRSRAWTRAITATACLVALIQICLFGASRLFPRASGPHSLVVSEVTALAIAELITVLAVYGLLRAESRSLQDLGLWQRATPLSWLLGIGLGLLTAFWGLSNPALHLQSRLGALLDPSPWHLYSALVAGTAAGLCEEIIFRGFVMQELAAAGHSRWVQVLGSAFLFGVAHAGLLRSGIMAGLLVIVPTAVLGALYSLIYIAGKRSLMPVIVSHFLNDPAVIPWIFLAVASRLGH
jgi:membrane protease YdiL (CAAX protease family)